MIKVENITINGKEYTRTWSDENLMIERDGALYEEAIDPIDSGRSYTETDQPIINEGDATDEDYRSALADLGVNFNE